MDLAAEPLDAAIVGGGVTGLALGFLLARRRPSWRIVVLEREADPGGTVRTLHERGFHLEAGPQGVLPAEGGAISLAREAGLEPVPAAPEARRRWIHRGGGLRELPTGPGAFLRSELLDPASKLRALAEPLVPRARQDTEESVHDFLSRRFGHGAARALAEPLVVGVTGGDPRELSLDALFPRLRAMEREHGSLLRAMAAAGRARRAERRSGEASAAGPRLHGFGAEGMGTLTRALARELGPALRPRANVRALAREDEDWRILLDDGERLLARRVALTVPAFVAAELLRDLDDVLADGLSALPYVGMRVVGLGYDRIDVPHPLDGFGYIVPGGSGARALGVLFPSTLFPGQAPAGSVQLRVLMGGRRDPEALTVAPDRLADAARRDLRITLGVTADPQWSRVVDWPRAIPQYGLGHAGRVRAWSRRVAAWPGLALAGSAYRGVGVNDCVRDARRVVDTWAPGGDAG